MSQERVREPSGEGAGAAQGRDHGGPQKHSGRDREERVVWCSQPRQHLRPGGHEKDISAHEPKHRDSDLIDLGWGPGIRIFFAPKNTFYVSKYVQPIRMSTCKPYSNSNEIVTFLFYFSIKNKYVLRTHPY